MAPGWVASGSRTQVFEFLEMATWILWWARWMLMVRVGCWWLCVMRKQNGAQRTVATQTELRFTSDCVYVSKFGTGYHRDGKCHGLRNTSRVNERRMCQIFGWSEALNHSAENRWIASRSQSGGAAS